MSFLLMLFRHLGGMDLKKRSEEASVKISLMGCEAHLEKPDGMYERPSNLHELWMDGWTEDVENYQREIGREPKRERSIDKGSPARGRL